MKRFLYTALLQAWLLSGSGFVWAKDVTALVEKLCRKGDALYRKGEYGEAIEQFRDAYQIDNRAGYLLIIADIYVKSRQGDEAIEALNEFNKKEPHPPAEREHQSKELRRAAEALCMTRTLIVAPRATFPSLALVPEPVAVTSALPATPSESLRHPLYKRWWLWTGISGAVGAAVAITLGVNLGMHPNKGPPDARPFP